MREDSRCICAQLEDDNTCYPLRSTLDLVLLSRHSCVTPKLNTCRRDTLSFYTVKHPVAFLLFFKVCLKCSTGCWVDTLATVQPNCKMKLQR